MNIPSAKTEVRKPSKTLAGVTPIAVMCKPKKCLHGTCIYCPSLNVPQSYTPKSPPVMRAERLNYNPQKQVESRLEAFRLMNHPTDKIELIVMGGNFTEYPRNYKINFIKACYDALNGKKSKNLEQAKKINEKAKHRCIALCIESRPDTLINNKNSIAELLDFGCTRVELGVQCLDDRIYRKVSRHHSVKDVADATGLLKNAGFKVGYHIMLGLPGSSRKKDLQMLKILFKDEKFKPDQLKIYPCQVIKGAMLESAFKKGKYKPYSEKEIKELVIKIMGIIPSYCRVMRVMREIPPEFLVAGTTRIDLRKDIEKEIRKRKLKIQEIRFREMGFAFRDLKPGKKLNQNLKLKVIKYLASRGKEYFLEFANKNNILFGLARLRINPDSKAFLRELHVYGQSMAIGASGRREQKLKKQQASSAQHRGLGRMLLQKAESIARDEGCKKLTVISGVGVREYFYKAGYSPDRDYVSKSLD